MNKLIQKNQKKIMAFFGVVLMLTFIKGLVPQGHDTGTVPRQIATLDGQPVTQVQVAALTSEWQLLKTLRFVDPNQPDAQSYPLPVAIFGEKLSSQINQDQLDHANQKDAIFFLLVQEARRQGIMIATEQLQSFLNNNVAPLPEEGTPERDQVEQAVNDCLLVKQMLDRADSAIKISRPYQALLLAESTQALSVKFVPVTISRFIDKVPKPTDADIQNQFDAYSDREPGEFGQAADPLGFGYKVPNRVQVQYIGVNHADLRTAAVASKSLQDWYVAAYGEFIANRDTYDAKPIPGAATRPALGPSTQSDVRKLDNVQDDFALHVPLVLDDLYDRKTDELQEAVLKQITEKLNSGFGAYRDAQAANDAASTAAIAQFTSIKFIRDLAVSIQSQYGLTPIVGDISQPKTESQLRQIEGIGASAYREQIRFNQYAIELFQPWLADEYKNSAVGSLALSPWQPSNPLSDASNNAYVFRISGSDPAHTPPLSDVKATVTADWKLSTAYDKALESAHVLLSRAQDRGLDAAASESGLPSPIITDLFVPEDIKSPQTAQPVISPLNLKPDSTRELADTAQQLLSTSPGANGRPQLLAQLYPDAIAAVIELHEARPISEPELKNFYTNKIIWEITQRERYPLEADLSAYANVAARLNYQPQTTPKPGP
jgi:hypothetical protein